MPENFTFDGSGEQTDKNTTFMKYIKEHDIDYHVTEPDLHQQNPAEGVIREVRRNWYRVMIRKPVPTRLCDYHMRWVSGIMAQTHTSEGDINGCIHLCRGTGKPLTYQNT